MDQSSACPMGGDAATGESNGEKGDQEPSVRVECLEKYNKDKTLGK